MLYHVIAFAALFSLGEGRTIIDLTHVFDKDNPKYPLGWLGRPNLTYYDLETLSEKWHDNGMWLSLKKVEFYEHQGTHMDAPFHFGYGRQTMEAIPVQRLVGPGVVINIREKALNDKNYAITVEDILEYEREYGMIPANAIVMMNSGWGEKYGNPNMVFGTDNLTDPTSFNFPGWSLDACKFLLNKRRISVLGVDTPSTDPGVVYDYLCHQYLQPNDVPLLEYVANLDSMPPAGSTIILGSFKIRHGTGGPVRIIAFVDDETDKESNSAMTMQMSNSLAIVTATLIYLFK